MGWLGTGPFSLETFPVAADALSAGTKGGTLTPGTWIGDTKILGTGFTNGRLAGVARILAPDLL
jgi:hypothetical protein